LTLHLKHLVNNFNSLAENILKVASRRGRVGGKTFSYLQVGNGEKVFPDAPVRLGARKIPTRNVARMANSV
jgi:hypothetical protein